MYLFIIVSNIPVFAVAIVRFLTNTFFLVGISYSLLGYSPLKYFYIVSIVFAQLLVKVIRF